MIPTLDQLVERIALPMEIDQALKAGFDLAISVSGGKDSDAMTRLLHHMRFQQQRGWTGNLILLHADLGRAEHRITPSYIQRFSTTMGLPLHVVSSGDLVDTIKTRKARIEAQGKDVPFWPSARARYCTSDLKRAPISAFLRKWAGKQGKIICAIGLRAEESSARAKREISKRREGVHTQSRTAYDWLPLHYFKAADVWAAIGYSLEELKSIQQRSRGMTPEHVFQTPFRAHPAYALGNERLSCGLCILANMGDLRNGAIQNPTVYREYVALEIESGYSFQSQRWLGDAAPELLPLEMQAALEEIKKQKGLSIVVQPQHPANSELPRQLALF